MSAVPPRSPSACCPGGVLHRRALKESFSVPPWRSASTPHLGGVHHLAELADYIRVWFFGRCPPLFLFRTSPAEGFLRALHLRAFCSSSSLFLFFFRSPCRIVFSLEFYHSWNFWLAHCASSEECFLTLPRRSASLRELGGVLHRPALEESFSAQPLRSASTPHLGGVHHLAELADYIRVWFFGSCSPLFFS